MAARISIFLRSLGEFVYHIVSTKRPDLIHLHTSHYGSFARKTIFTFLSRSAGIPVVLHIHAGKFGYFYGEMPRPVQSVVRWTLANANVVVALGEGWANRLREICGDANVVAIPNPIRIGAAAHSADSNWPDDKVRFAFLGKINEAKGVFVLLESWAQVVDNLDTGDARPHLTIAGSGELDRAEAFVRDRGIEAFVTIQPWLDSSAVAALLRQSDILVLPSMYEGQPMSILEAMSNRMCVVATDVGGIPDLVIDGVTGMLVPADDVEALRAALMEVLVDSDKRTMMGFAGMDRARHEFDIEHLWRRVDSLYRGLLSSAGEQG